jgi:hypothetical protein
VKVFLSTFTVFYSAEREGFEPSVVHRATTVFETAPFSHCGTSPNAKIILEND